jgi:hypothetical protein
MKLTARTILALVVLLASSTFAKSTGANVTIDLGTAASFGVACRLGHYQRVGCNQHYWGCRQFSYTNRNWTHRVAGEGHFVYLFQRRDRPGSNRPHRGVQPSSWSSMRHRLDPARTLGA